MNEAEAEAELAVSFDSKSPLPDEELLRLTAAARAAGSTWPAMAAACGVRGWGDLTGVTSGHGGASSGAEVMFRAAQYAREKLTGSKRRFPALSWDCPGCGQQVTDCLAEGRPVHTELGHGQNCSRLARDQAADDARRSARLQRTAVESDRLIYGLECFEFPKPVIDDCPRCGWHGNFWDCAVIDGDWSRAICDNCIADLRSDVTVTVTFYSVRSHGDKPHGVIRQRKRSDHRYPDAGQVMYQCHLA